MARIVAIDGQSERRLETGWRMAITADAACATPREAAALPDWLPARVPATAAGILNVASDGALSLHDQDVWWRLPNPPSGRQRLRFDGLATLCEVWLDETLIARSTSMFVPLEVEVDIPHGSVLWLCFRALTGLFERKLPRARWRPRMIPRQALRGVRTTLLGQMPGWTPPIDAVGPFRPITAVTPGPVACRRAQVLATLDETGAGRLTAHVRLDGADRPPILRCAGAQVALRPTADGAFEGDLIVSGVEPWWPHTHGDQPLYPVTLAVGETIIDLGRTGFRDLRLDRGPDGDGFQLVINGEPVFCRGAVWTNADIVGLGGDRASYEPWLRLAREAGMNMLRMSGTGVYESPDFFALCDELGILVWQDFMFANFDYPIDLPEFARAIEAETEAFLDRTQLSPSLAVLCGGSEVRQQATMLGLRPEAAGHALFDAILPRSVRTWRPDVAYVDNSPSGGALPFVTDVGVAHYFGVGAYRRPLDDARRADVKFAGECLGFSNIPQPETLRQAMPEVVPGDAVWKAATQRDLGADWDFEDVRDHYLAMLRDIDPARLLAENPALYLDLGRAVTGEAMAAVFAEWRRIGSRCGGALVWTLQDLRPGAGWGVIDSYGRPKQAWYALKRALQPLHLGLTDEGGNGLHIHLRNETARDEILDLELVCLRDGATQVLRAARRVALPARGALRLSSFELIGAFFDIAYAYRFGPLGHDATVVSLRRPGETQALAEAFHYPRGAAGVHVEAAPQVERIETSAGWALDIATDRLLRDVRIEAPGYRPLDDGFDLAPGRNRRIDLIALNPAAAPPAGEVVTPGRRVTARFPS